MSPPVVLVLCDGPSPVDPETGRQRYAGGDISRVAERLGGMPVSAFSSKPADVVVVGWAERAAEEKLLIEQLQRSKVVLYGSENLEAWFRDRARRAAG